MTPPPKSMRSLSHVSRRAWGWGTLAGGIVLSGMRLRQWWNEAGASRATWRPGPYGPLRDDPRGVLDLPEGFTYRVLSRGGAPMSDGRRTPAMPDGMACFEGIEPGTWILMRNHELQSAHREADGPGPVETAFDPRAHGGVTKVVVDAATLAVRESRVVLAGTIANCAGGTSPWGWLSCEETVEEGHGYVFACDPRDTEPTRPSPIRVYGRFRHEAAIVDPETKIAYLTEDREDACFYRFRPVDAAHPFEGKLQALAVTGRPRFDTGQQGRSTVDVAWIDVDDPDPSRDTIREAAQARGAALVRRGEGLAFAERPGGLAVLFSATIGGAQGTGQILELTPDGDGGQLSVLAESHGRSDFDMPDNLVVAPGGRVFFCEDGPGGNCVRAIDLEGGVFDFARNARDTTEFAGVCFAPDGSTMFVNIQGNGGLTLAIRGPFASV